MVKKELSKKKLKYLVVSLIEKSFFLYIHFSSFFSSCTLVFLTAICGKKLCMTVMSALQRLLQRLLHGL